MRIFKKVRLILDAHHVCFTRICTKNLLELKNDYFQWIYIRLIWRAWMFSLCWDFTSSTVAQNVYQFLGSQWYTVYHRTDREIVSFCTEIFKTSTDVFVRKTFSFRIIQKSEDKSNAFVKMLINGSKIMKIWTFQSKFFKVRIPIGQ